MTTNNMQPSIAILLAADSHRKLLAAASALFRDFEDIVKNGATTDFDSSWLRHGGDVENLGDFLNDRLHNEFHAYRDTLRRALADFRGRDANEASRNIALGLAGPAFTRLRTAAREHIIAKVEG